MNFVVDKQLAILIIGRVAQVLIMMVSIKVSTTLLSPAGMGNLYLIMSICSFFGFFFISPIGAYVNRKTHEWHYGGLLLNKLFNYNYYILSASVLSFFVIIGLYHFGIANSVNYKLLIIAVPLFVFFNTWNQTIISMINMLEHRAVFTVLTILTLITALGFSYFIIISFGKDGLLWFTGQVLGFSLLAIVSLIYFIVKIENKISVSMAHSDLNQASLIKILCFAMPLSVGVFFLWVQNQSYRLIIEKYIGAEFLGYFGVGMAIAIAISSSFETIVIQFLFPKMYKNMNDEGKFKIIFSNIINIILPIYFLLAIFVSLFAIYLTAILVDKKYASSFIFVIFGIWIEFFRTSSGLVSNIAHSKMQTKSIIFPYALGGIFVAVGTYFAAQSKNYALFVPIVLIVGGLLTFWQMLMTMNKLVSFELEFRRFIYILLYSLPFCIASLFYDYCDSYLASISIIGAFGFYFLFVLYRVIRTQGVMV